MKKAIETIGKKVLDNLFNFDKNELNYDSSFLYEDCTYCTCKVDFDMGKTNINCIARYENDKLAYCEVEVYRKGRDYENLQEAVQKYIDENFDDVELYNLIDDELSSRVPYDEPYVSPCTHKSVGVAYRLCG